MARRSKKPKAPSTGAGSDTDDGRNGDEGRAVDPNLALFASYVHDDRERAQAAKRQAREQRRQAEEADALVRAKDDAAAEVKRLRSRSGATPEERAAADATYREALAAVVAAETGEAPAWAPPPGAGEDTDDQLPSTEPTDGEGAGPGSDGEDGSAGDEGPGGEAEDGAATDSA